MASVEVEVETKVEVEAGVGEGVGGVEGGEEIREERETETIERADDPDRRTAIDPLDTVNERKRLLTTFLIHLL